MTALSEGFSRTSERLYECYRAWLEAINYFYPTAENEQWHANINFFHSDEGEVFRLAAWVDDEESKGFQVDLVAEGTDAYHLPNLEAGDITLDVSMGVEDSVTALHWIGMLISGLKADIRNFGSYKNEANLAICEPKCGHPFGIVKL